MGSANVVQNTGTNEEGFEADKKVILNVIHFKLTFHISFIFHSHFTVFHSHFTVFHSNLLFRNEEQWLPHTEM